VTNPKQLFIFKELEKNKCDKISRPNHFVFGAHPIWMNREAQNALFSPGPLTFNVIHLWLFILRNLARLSTIK